MGEWGQQIGGQRQARTQLEAARIQAQAAKDIENQRGNRGMLGGALGGLGTAVGYMYGGPAGAAVGSQIGGQVGSQMAYGGEIPESQMNLKPTHDNQGCYACGGPVQHLAMGGPSSMPMIESVEPGTVQPTWMEQHGRDLGRGLQAMGRTIAKGQGSSNPQSIIGSYLNYSNGGPVNMTGGGRVPGQAMYPGDTLANDTVPAMLSPKEIVIPRSIAMSEDAGDKAKAFVEAIRAKYAQGNKG
jgi:hypothetical protein